MSDLLNPRKFRRWLLWTLAIPLTGAAIFAGILILQIDRQHRNASDVDHNDLIISNGVYLLKAVLDQETGVRDYLLTGRSEFLEPYHSGRQEAENRLRQLSLLIRRNPEQQQRVAAIREHYEAWQQYADQAMQSSGKEPHGYESELQGKQLMDGLRVAVSSFLLHEEDLRQQRLEHTRDQSRQIYIYVGSFSIFFAILTGILSMRRLRRLSEVYNDTLQLSTQQARELNESHRWFSTTLSSIGDGVIATDASGRVVFMNPTAKKMTGHEEEVAGRPLGEVFKICDEFDRSACENPFEKVRRLGTVVGLANHTCLIRKDGQEIPIADSGAPIQDTAGNLLGVVIVFSDMSERKETERVLRTTERFAALGRLAASVAHEIHNPLDAVGNALFLIQRNGKLDDVNQVLVETASSELAKANEISRNMLGLYRQASSPTAVNVPELIDSAVNLLLGKIREKGMQVRQDVRFRGTVFGFAAELRQVLVNLLSNAIEASPTGGAIEIRTEAGACALQGSTQGLLIEIQDEGSGISPEVLPRLFQPFMTTKGASGTGLGLWVSRSIIEKHAGSLTAKSRQNGHGAIFSICLPAG